jgi:uncharacterized protein
VNIVGTTALVTGASSGIGERFARSLADRGAHLVLAARSADRLEALAAELRAAHPGRRVEVRPTDLSRPGAPADLAAGLEVDLLVNNAGFATRAPVAEEDPARVAEEVALNCAATVALTTLLLPGLLARRRGGVVNVASTAAFQPLPGMAVYAATKAFVLSFTEALWAETRGTGVDVLALCPGPTETPFFEVASPGRPFLTRGRQTVDEVVDAALAALERGHGPTVVPGLRNRVLAQGYRFTPRAVMARVSARVAGA